MHERPCGRPIGCFRPGVVAAPEVGGFHVLQRVEGLDSPCLSVVWLAPCPVATGPGHCSFYATGRTQELLLAEVFVYFLTK
jgi:hypothetical protein